MVWFVLFVPFALVLAFDDLRDLLSVELGIAAFAVLGLSVVMVRRRVGPRGIVAGTILLSLAALVWIRH